jgi:hypothetical protein
MSWNLRVRIFLRNGKPLQHHKEVMLAGLPDVHIQLGYAGKKVAHLSPHADAAKQFDVKPCAKLENSRRGPGFAGVSPARLQRGILFEIAEASARTGEIPLSGKRLARNAGVTKNDL